MTSPETKSHELESGFKVNNIVLLESNFKRVPNVHFEQFSVNTNIEVNTNVTGNIILVTEKMVYSHSFNDIKEVECTIVMTGVFEKFGDTILSNDLEKFGRINGAAILFPYIREHLTNLSSKAGLGLIILPPANFTKIEKNE